MNVTLKCMYCLLILSSLLTLLTDKKTMHILQELRIPNKLVRLIKMTLQITEASVQIENIMHSSTNQKSKFCCPYFKPLQSLPFSKHSYQKDDGA